MPKLNLSHIRIIIFLAVLGIHVLLLFLVVFNVENTITTLGDFADVMKLTDIQEIQPEPEVEDQILVEAIADVLIETEEIPENIVLVAPGSLNTVRVTTEEDYLPMHKISVPPAFSEREITQALVYPPIALRSGIEGMVYLELFVDRDGEVRRVTVLREDPANRGFGEAAVSAFQGLKGTPAQANGVPVAVRYRYPVRFVIKG